MSRKEKRRKGKTSPTKSRSSPKKSKRSWKDSPRMKNNIVKVKQEPYHNVDNFPSEPHKKNSDGAVIDLYDQSSGTEGI